MFFWVDIIFQHLQSSLINTNSGINDPNGRIIIYALIIIPYIFSCFCLQRIFRKLGVKPDWLAWIPVANLWGIYKAGNESPWWTVPLVISSLFSLENWLSRGVLWPFSLLAGNQIINWTGLVPQDLIPAKATSFNLLQYVHRLDDPMSTLIYLALFCSCVSFLILGLAWIRILKRLGRSPWLVILVFFPMTLTSWWLMFSLQYEITE
jgi:hypothetical protein